MNVCSRFDDEQKIIVDDKSQEEIIIDEILSMPIDSLLRVPKVPDRLLSPLVTRPRPPATVPPSQNIPAPDPASILLPRPLAPPYLPTKEVLLFIELVRNFILEIFYLQPVSSVWSSRHTTDRLYRYTHFERIVYPHERVIVPPAYAR